MGTRPNESFDPKIAALIQYKARRLVGRYRFRSIDSEDLAQQLTMEVLRALPKHDRNRASAMTFASRICDNKLATVIDHYMAKKRDRRRERLDDSLVRVPCNRVQRSQDRRAAAMDVTAALAKLPAGLKEIAQLLMHMSTAEIVREKGLSRQRVRTARKHIAQRLAAMGLGPGSPN